MNTVICRNCSKELQPILGQHILHCPHCHKPNSIEWEIVTQSKHSLTIHFKTDSKTQTEHILRTITDQFQGNLLGYRITHRVSNRDISDRG